MRPFRALLAIITIVTTVSPVSAQSWSDVPGTPYLAAYQYLLAKGAVADGQSGRPHDLINRAEALRVLLDMRSETRAQVNSSRAAPSRLSLFNDVGNEWYRPYVDMGFRNSIITGYPDKTFRAANGIKNEEAVAIIMRLFGVPVGQAGGEWYVPYMKEALARNLIADPTGFTVGQYITRGQFFDMAYRMETVREQQLAVFPGGSPSSLPAPVAAASVPAAPAPSPLAASVIGADVQQYGSKKAFSITIPKMPQVKDIAINHPQDANTQKGLLAVLNDGVGHLLAYPGQGKRVIIYAHSSGYTWDTSKYTRIFRTVNTMQPGDRIYVTLNGQIHIYEVTGHRIVPASDLSPYVAGNTEELMIYTCWPPDKISDRYLLTAKPVGQVAVQY